MQLDKFALPWKSGLFQIVSLLDMLKICPEDFHILMRELEALSNDGELFEISRIRDTIDKASDYCNLVDLNASLAIINQLYERIKPPEDLFADEIPINLGEPMRMLHAIIKDELRERLFMFIPQDDAEWFEKKDGFGIEVSTAFHSAIEDIKEAGTCYATGRYTACVFHLMRILEHGLKALAKNLSLTFGKKTWGKIIGMIDEKIDDFYKSNPQTEAEIERLQFLSEAATDFRYFKNSWRDHVSHLRYTCKDRGEALLILNHVKSFMVHLSTQLTEIN